MIDTSYYEIINNGLSYQGELGAEVAARAKTHFEINLVGKSHDGGWPAFLRIRCPNCAAQYMLYAGVSEPSNGVHIVTIQGLAELNE